MSEHPKAAKLAQFREPQYVELPDAFDRDGNRIVGRTLPVRQIDPIAAELAEGLRDGTSADPVGDMKRIGRRLLPDATADEIGSLDAICIADIVAAASGQLNSFVERLREEGKSEAAGPTPPTTETTSDGSASS